MRRLVGLESMLSFAAALVVAGCGSDDADSPETATEAANGGGTSGGGTGGGGAGAGAMPSASGCSMSSGGTVVTSLCAAAPLNALTQAQAAQLCTDTGAYVGSTVDKAIGCKFLGIIAAASSSSPTEAQLQAACSGREASCNTQGGAQMGLGANTQCGQIPTTCSATIEQYSKCVQEQAMRFEQGASALGACNVLTFASITPAYDVPTLASAAPTCMAIQTACAGFSVPYIN